LDGVVTDTDTLRLRVRIGATPESVYKALTDPDAMTDWLAESAEVALDDGQFEFWGRYAPQGDRARQRLLEAQAGRTLRFEWAFDGADPTTVGIDLTGADETTVVEVTHSGLPADLTALHCFWYVSLANLCAYCEGLATMPPFDFSVPAQDAALVRTVIDAPVEEVFASLLDPAQVDRWTLGTAVIEPTVGGRYDFGWDHGPGQILELETDKVLAYSWRHDRGPDTVVRWQLRSARGSTFVTLVHSGFDDETFAEEFRQDWPGYLVEIKRMLELGADWEPMKVTQTA
jgi:uncharacterized protein YndB with AHSA1/START domain